MENYQKTEATADISIRKQNGRWTRSEEEKADTFAEHFSKIF